MKSFLPIYPIPLLFLILFSTAKSQSFSPLMYDKNQSQYFGAANLTFIHKALYTFEERYIPDTLFSEKTFLKKSVGIGYRLSKLFFLDCQTDRFISLAQHEAFGHGARYREFGHRENSYHLNLFFPFGNGSGFARSGPVESGYIIGADERIMKTIGGSEGNLVLGNTLSAQMFLKKNIHYRDALLYLNSKNDLFAYIWYTRYLDFQNNIPSSNDVSSYIFEINSRFYNSDINYNIKRLSMQSLVSLLNPIQLYSAFAIGYQYLFKGKKELGKLPMIHIGKIEFLPSFDFKLTPWGSEFQMSNHLVTDKRVFKFDFGTGDASFEKYVSMGISIYQLISINRLNLNLQLNVWNQPELNLVNPSYERNENKTGGMIKTEIHFAPLKSLSCSRLYLQTGFKTKGYTLGEPLEESLIIRFGLSLKI